MCVHHYLGVAFRRAFVVWFAPGIVMVFKRMPEYSRGSGLRAYGPWMRQRSSSRRRTHRKRREWGRRRGVSF